MRLVFNLYPFNEHLYLPSAFLVQSDRDGTLTYTTHKAGPLTLSSFGIQTTAAEDALLACAERLAPKALEARFKPPKAKSPTPLAQLLAQIETKANVEAYIHRELDRFLSDIVRHNIPIALDIERKTLVQNVLLIPAKEDLIPHLSFKKTPEGVEYRFRLGTEQQHWSISEYDAVPLTNTDPAWIVSRYTLFRAPGVNGNMVRPFRKKDLIQIPPDKTRVFFKQFVVKNAGRTRIEAEGFDMQINRVLDTVRIEPTENVLEKKWLLKPVFVYGNVAFLPGEKRDRVASVAFSDDESVTVRQVCRDAALEAERLSFLQGVGLSGDGRNFWLEGRESIDEIVFWLANNRARLEKAGFTLENPQYEGRSIRIARGAIEVRSDIDGDWFDVRGEVEIGDLRFPFRDFVPYLRRQDRLFPLPDGDFFLIPETWFTRYADLAKALKTEGDQLRLPRALYTILQENDGEQGESASAIEGFPVIEPEKIDYQPSPLLKADLRPYQRYGVQWLIGHYQHGFGACLADDMGLGKTLQTIAVLLYAKEKRAQEIEEGASAGGPLQLDLFQAQRRELKPLNALIILPASLVFNWRRELQRFAPSLFVESHVGPKRLKDVRALSAFDAVLTTYHTARQDLALLEKNDWHFIVLDESQQIKNRESEVSKVVRALRADHKISLSGTPIENSLSDLWTQMEFINPDTLGSYGSFKEEFQTPIEKQGDDAAKERLFRRVRPFFLRRTKEAVAPELPPLNEQVFYTEMNAAQRKCYESVKSAVRNEILALFDDPKSRLQALQALSRLRQIAGHPAMTETEYAGGSGKFDDVLAQWDTIRRAGHKALFFSSFVKHLTLFEAAFQEAGVPYARLTGDTDPEARRQAVDRFQNDPSVQAFFISLKAGGTGLNLTAADYVFMLDPWWNPAAEAQAIARAHRIGQTNKVNVLRFISRDTIEEKILLLQEKKRALGQSFFAGGEATPEMTRADIEMLLA